MIDLITLLFLACFSTHASPESIRIKSHRKQVISISEPSDICRVEGTDRYFIVSDQGRVFHWNPKGESKELPIKLWDAEGVCFAKGLLCVMEETPRRVILIDTLTNKVVEEYSLPHQGGRNQGFESLACDDQGAFLSCTEKNPAEFRLLDPHFNEIKRFSIREISEVSAIAFHQNQWWVLSDEASCVYVLNRQFEYIRQIRINVFNPEGITFSPDGEMLILSDDLHTLYYFKLP
jgi:hypothetical protein